MTDSDRIAKLRECLQECAGWIACEDCSCGFNLDDKDHDSSCPNYVCWWIESVLKETE